jgi:thiopeptide-type bacteriocin biosynthesis protein
LLDALGLTHEERAKIFGDAREMLGREMNANTPFWGRIGERFAKERASLDVMFARDPASDAGHDLEPGFELLAHRDAHVRELAGELRARDAAGELTPPLASFAWSMVHMHCNRLLHASQRAQELVLYDFLRRLYAARRARSK